MTDKATEATLQDNLRLGCGACHDCGVEPKCSDCQRLVKAADALDAKDAEIRSLRKKYHVVAMDARQLESERDLKGEIERLRAQRDEVLRLCDDYLGHNTFIGDKVRRIYQEGESR